jgi:hypothetical protein
VRFGTSIEAAGIEESFWELRRSPEREISAARRKERTGRGAFSENWRGFLHFSVSSEVFSFLYK